MDTMTLPGTAEGARDLSRRLREPDWLTDWRVRAFDLWQASGLPIRAGHLWRYTDPAIFDPARDPFATDPGPREVRVEGEPEASGLILTDLGTAAREYPDLVRPALGSVVGPEYGRFEALAAAGFTGGVFLRVPRGVSVPNPIHITTRFDGAIFQAGRLLALVEEGASVTIVDAWEGGPAKDGRVFNVGEVIVGAGARVQVVSVQEFEPQVHAHLTQVARLGPGAHYTQVLASFGGALVKTSVGAILDGEGAESEMTGFLSAVGRQRFDHHTLHHHVGRHTRSNLDYKTVLKHRARSAYTGLIRIEKEASFSEAYQENRNLLLSDRARVDSIPELEILTEEVRCTHGATVGPIDRDQLFYLMSRAVPRDEAVRMVIEGHFESALKRLPEALQERMRTLVRERLREA